MGSNMRYERDVKMYKVEMILIYHLYPIIIGGTKRKIFGGNLKNGKEERQSAKGRQVITLTLL